jgi:glycosyltransferase involved in cell wall biosynthesis
MLKRVLIITYYWPPSGGSAVLRWLKFTKYLRDYGWEPVIYTPENPEPQEIDESLLTDIPDNLEILKTRIIEPYTVYKWLTGRKKADRLGVALMADKKKSGIFGKFSLWIRSNLFIPDPRILWIKPSMNFLDKYLDKNPVDIIISTGPPHSMHLIAKRLKEKKGIKWLADFRDPWTNIDFYRELTLTKHSDRKHRKLEMEVLRSADHIVTVSPGMTGEFKKMGIADVTTVTNGYDDEILKHAKPLPLGFNIVHLGSMPKSRNPQILWEALNEILQTEPGLQGHLKVHLIGKTDIAIVDSIKLHHLENFVKQHAYIPHAEAQGILSSASVLLLCINNSENAGGILTNKFFEYLSAHRPILAIGPVNGDAATILDESGAGKIFEYTDVTGLKNHLIALFNLYTKNALEVNSKNIERFSRKSLTYELSNLLNRLTN